MPCSTSRARDSTGSTSSMTPSTRVAAWVRTPASTSSKVSASRTLPGARSATMASTAQARQSSSSAGTVPCGLFPSASFWALVSRARTRFQGAVVFSRRSRRTPRRVAARASRSPAARRGRPPSAVDQSRVALHPLAARLGLERLRQWPEVPLPQAFSLDRGSRSRHPALHLAGHPVLQAVEVLPRGEGPPAVVVDTEGDPQVVEDSGDVHSPSGTRTPVRAWRTRTTRR